MKKLRRFIERIVESLLTVSGAITGIAILLIVIFLFKEGVGLFNSPTVEDGYALYVNNSNKVQELNPFQIKNIFDSEITN